MHTWEGGHCMGRWIDAGGGAGACMCAGAISVQHEAGTLKLDDWATFTAPARIAVLVRELRQQLDRLLLQHIHNPQAGALQSPVIQVCHELICRDGF